MIKLSSFSENLNLENDSAAISVRKLWGGTCRLKLTDAEAVRDRDKLTMHDSAVWRRSGRRHRIRQA